MSIDYFDCRKCGYGLKPSDERAKSEDVCDSYWTEYFMSDWYSQLEKQRSQQKKIGAKQKHWKPQS